MEIDSSSFLCTWPSQLGPSMVCMQGFIDTFANLWPDMSKESSSTSMEGDFWDPTFPWINSEDIRKVDRTFNSRSKTRSHTSSYQGTYSRIVLKIGRIHFFVTHTGYFWHLFGWEMTCLHLKKKGMLWIQEIHKPDLGKMLIFCMS